MTQSSLSRHEPAIRTVCKGQCGSVVTTSDSIVRQASFGCRARSYLRPLPFRPARPVTFVPAFMQTGSRSSSERFARTLRRVAYMVSGLLVVLLGILIAPLPGPGGIPVIALGLVLILRSSFWAKRQFIRAQYARPKYVYPFRRLLRKNPEIAPVFWQQALRAEKVVLKSTHRRLARVRRSSRRFWRRNFSR